MIAPGSSETLKLGDLEPGTYDFICAVPGHAESGMKGTLVVQEGAATGSDGDAPASAGSHAGHEMMTAQQMADVDAAVTSKFPAKTKGVGLQELKPRIGRDGTKVFELTADEVKWEIEPGKFVDAYAYNGMVPGPTIKAELGDRVKIVLTNKLAEPTTIHHHGLTVPADMDGVPGIARTR